MCLLIRMTSTRQQREEERARDERLQRLREEQRRLAAIEREQEARLRYNRIELNCSLL